ncbi:hypothetical protein [Caenimonas sp. SL110]|uniref:hypothetical protein n=1 Tax=Caenimonas sp. SL110 TaxID=1450524 RepID=UPI00128CA39B|nr:hypothetical protein [Caenimonas sp. SL110]
MKQNHQGSSSHSLIHRTHQMPQSNPPARSLLSTCRHVIIVAHTEDTSNLRRTLTAEGFEVAEVRGPYTHAQRQYSASFRCFVNHANAWRIAANRSLPTIIVEADFVPVKKFGSLRVPAPAEKFNNCLPYLYACAPSIWDLDGPVARGHAGGLVATVVWPRVAAMLLEFFDQEIAANPLGAYSPFDSRLGYWLKDRGVETYLPYRQYGEHGGLSNPEHAIAGLGRPHQADVLHDSVAFMPAYAQGSKWKLWRTRLLAKLWGFGRLGAGRFLSARNFARGDRWKLIRFAAGRLIFAREPE